MLEVKHLVKRYGPIAAVNDVSFKIEKGEVLGFLGPNGAGKTTTMRMVTGFLPPTSGTALIGGHDILKDPVQAKRLLGYLPESAPAYESMLVRNFLRFIAEIRGMRGAEATTAVETAIAKCRLEEVANRAIGHLSKGYRGRVGFAQAIIHDPPILVMDEPTDGLDPNQKHTVREMIKDMASEKAIIVSTHILEEVDAVCTRAIIISRGQIVANGTPDELKAMSPTGELTDVFRMLTLDKKEATLSGEAA
ncbi:MAG: ABC-2 type transport system ATP-binding protein [Candidatus Promineifilaceae bacterium]|jgi:ABC-2 type transport system ATP-binding protein